MSAIKWIKTKASSIFHNKPRKQIEDWDFIMVLESSYKQSLEKDFKSMKCQDKFSWFFIDNPQDKEVLALLKLSQQVVQDQATKLKMLKKKNKKSYDLTQKQINTLLFDAEKQKDQDVKSYYKNYLSFIKARLDPKMKDIYQQEQFSAFNKKKKNLYQKNSDNSLFTPQQQLRAKYNFLLTYSEVTPGIDPFKFLSKIFQITPTASDYRSTVQQTQTGLQSTSFQPFIKIMDKPQFKELVPIHRTSLFSPIELHSIKGYLGANEETYFDFLEFFQRWLIFPMIFGLIAIAVNFFGDYTADNSPADFIYALFVMIWSILFITKWEENQNWEKIKQSSGYNDFWSQYQRVVVKKDLATRKSQITGIDEYYLPFSKKILWQSVSFGIVTFIVFVTLVFMVLSLNARGFVDQHHKLIYFETISNWASTGGIFDKDTYWGQIPNIVHVLVTNLFDQNVYRPIARKLALMERHTNQKSYENSIIWKFFIYEFIITFADLFYIAFVRFDIDGLRQQLVSLFIIDIIRRVVAETLIPWWNKKRVSSGLKKQEQEQLKYSAILQTKKQSYEPFDDYLQIVTNFGYLVMISSCFPIAPLLIMVAHFVEDLQDKYKITYIFKRKLPKKYVGMGSWKAIILFLCYFSIVTNIMLFAFSSQQIVTVLPILYEGGKDVLYGNKFISDILTTGGASFVDFLNLDELVRHRSTHNTEDDGWGDFWQNKQPEGVYQNNSKQNDNANIFSLKNAFGNNQEINVEQQAKVQSSATQKGTIGGLNFGLLNNKANQKPPDSQVPQNTYNPENMFKTFNQPPTQSSQLHLQTYRPPSQQHQATFIIILFVLEHFFLGIFLWLRYALCIQETYADIFLKRREYKRRIKKHLPANFMETIQMMKNESKFVKSTKKSAHKQPLQQKMESSKSTSDSTGIAKLISSALVGSNEMKQQFKKDE